MKAIQITVDEDLLKAIDATPEAQEQGRSAVFRHAVAAYLRSRRAEQIDAAYERGYANRADDDLAHWSDEGVWPEK